MQKKQLSVLVLIILCFLLGCNRETPKDESQQNYEDESNISKTNHKVIFDYLFKSSYMPV